MNKNQTKGIAFIVGGILSLFILPYICRMFGLYMIYEWLEYNYLKYIIALVVAGLGIKTLISKDTDSEEEDAPIASSQTTATTGQGQSNKVVNVTLTGGIIGMLAASPLSSLNKVIKRENANGWKVIQVIPAESGNIFLTILRLLILVFTLFLYTTANGFYVIMEKK